LAREIPESGGEYLFLSRTVHPALGYLAGWVSLLVGFSAPLAAAAFAFGEYASGLDSRIEPRVAGTILTLAFAAVHAANVRHGARLQDWVVLFKVLLMVGFVGWALPRLQVAPDTVSAPFALPVFGVSLVWISFSYSGWNAAVYLGGEIRDPERNLPRSLLLGTGIVTVLYLALNAVFVFGAPAEAIAGQVQVGRIAAEALGGLRVGQAVSVLIMIALATSVSSLVMAGPRVYAQMAQDGYLPGFLRVRPGQPPRNAIVFQAGLALLLLWTSPYESLLTYIGFTLSLSTAATVVGLMLRRRVKGPSLKVPGWPWLPVTFLLSVLGIAVFVIQKRPLESLLVLLTLAVGWGFWVVQRGRQDGWTTGRD
jgi:APA family basic amino acid/polyamine antiporter